MAPRSAPSRPSSAYRLLGPHEGGESLTLLQTLTDFEQRRAVLLGRRTANDPKVQSLTQTMASIENKSPRLWIPHVRGLDEEQRRAASRSCSCARVCHRPEFQMIGRRDRPVDEHLHPEFQYQEDPQALAMVRAAGAMILEELLDSLRL